MSNAIGGVEPPDHLAVRGGFVNGRPRLAFDRAGEGELVVLLHGVGGCRRNWSEQLAVLARHFHAVAWDARGYGDSDDYDGSLDFGDYADDLVRLLEHFKTAAAHIVGLSMGGNIAMDFAVRYGSRVRSLVLCDTDRGMTHLSAEERQHFLRLRRDPLLANMELADVAAGIVESLSGPYATEHSRKSLTDSLLRLHKESYLKSLEATVNFDIRHTIAQIVCPTLVVVGEFDALTPVSEARAICAEIRNSQLVVIAGAGHLSNIEQPQAFDREVLHFLQNVPR